MSWHPSEYYRLSWAQLRAEVSTWRKIQRLCRPVTDATASAAHDAAWRIRAAIDAGYRRRRYPVAALVRFYGRHFDPARLP